MHGRGAKLERTISRIDQLVPPSQHWNMGPVEMMGQSDLRWAHVTHRQFKTVWFWHPFLPVKSHDHFLHFSLKNATFSRPKKGPRTGRYHSLSSLTAIQFSDHSKSKRQTTSRQEPWSTLQMPPAKINYFPDEEEGRRTSVFLHYRTDRALRAKIWALNFEKQKS